VGAPRSISESEALSIIREYDPAIGEAAAAQEEEMAEKEG
jgi:hypothetical protein